MGTPLGKPVAPKGPVSYTVETVESSEGIRYRLRLNYANVKQQKRGSLYDSRENLQRYLDRFHPDLPEDATRP